MFDLALSKNKRINNYNSNIYVRLIRLYSALLNIYRNSFEKLK
jgi:hypothetical protein